MVPPFPMDLSVSKSNEGDKKIFVGVLRDISDCKSSELAMELANRERNLILNSAGEGIYGLDMEGNTTQLSSIRQHAKFWGTQKKNF
jgi:hypothetical protein